MYENIQLTIVTINYNDREGLLKTCNSLYSQSCQDFEHIIIDGNSKDGSHIIGEHFAQKGSTFISEEDSGIYDAMRKGVVCSSGKFIAFLNAGDIYINEQVVERLLGFIKTQGNEEVQAFYGNKLYQNQRGEITRYWRPGRFHRLKYLYGWMTPHQSTIVRANLYSELGSFRTDLRIAADYELMFRFFVKQKISPVYLETDIVLMQAGGVSNSDFRSVLRSNFEVLKSWWFNGYLPPVWIFMTKPGTKLLQFIDQRNDRNV